LIRTKVSDTKYYIPVEKNKTNPKHVLKTLKEMYPELSGINFKPIKGSEKDLLTLDIRLSVDGYKFGVLYVRRDQTTEQEWFQNTKMGKDFEEFLEFIGEKITLKGWNRYNGGLDVEADSSGIHSIFTSFDNYEIMFHVSTLLPFTEDEAQQLARKRHLGNDIVLLVFMEGDTNLVFDPTKIRTNFNHVFFVVKKDRKESKARGNTVYRMSVASKDGVADITPGLPDPTLLNKDTLFREYLLTKLINAERAAYCAPGFCKALERTKEGLLQEIFDIHFVGSGGTSMAGWT